jgi:S1-C subfamily serine protease
MLRFVFASVLIVPVAFAQIALTTAQIAKRVSPSVVVIQGKTDSGSVLGSGFILSKDGNIVTNLHVIRDMKTASVQLANGEVFDSLSVLAVDERRDLAIVQIAGFNLPVLELGNSDTLNVGEAVVAVGSPLGLEATVTAGILSAIRDGGHGFTILQTDAAVNHGNSGGPLVAANGLAIGVVSSIVRSDSAQGLSFAIPINYVRGLLDSPHARMTLAQMRKGLIAGTSTPEPTDSSPSLKATLGFLREKIPLGIVHYVHSSDAIPLSVVDQAALWAFDSCTVIFGHVMTFNLGGHSGSITTRYTLPLGVLTGSSVERRENLSPGHPEATFVAGERWGYHLFLKSKAKEMSFTRVPADPNYPSDAGNVDWLDLTPELCTALAFRAPVSLG